MKEAALPLQQLVNPARRLEIELGHLIFGQSQPICSFLQPRPVDRFIVLDKGQVERQLPLVMHQGIDDIGRERNIFQLGTELEQALRRGAGEQSFLVGITDAVPKSIAFQLLAPAMKLRNNFV